MNNKRKIFIGSRKSNLAKLQSNLVCNKLMDMGIKNLKINHIISEGDKKNFQEFKNLGGKGLFTKEIDNMLLNKKIDIAVHSAKDMPAFIDKNITIAAFLPREDVREVLVTKNFNIKSILDIKEKINFGSSSPRRINYLKNLIPYIKIKHIRGNVESRIQLVRQNKIDATLLAYAGLKRLKLKYDDINFIKIPTKIILPAPGQAAIAIVCRKEDKEVLNILKKIDHLDTRLTVSAEREFIKEINGDCFTPLAVLAKVNGNKLEINGKLFSDNGKISSKAKITSNIIDYIKAGRSCAKKVLEDLKNK
ncbi:MAG: hydroxymethylbilane synthase [Pelagibacterales bacterium]|nr:hydroxymethylbilane synthase [Pelagibacterales bacterium]